MNNLSACVFIKNNINGGFCLFESMHQLLPLADEFIVMDLGSDDGTYEILMEIASANYNKVRLYRSTWPTYEDDNGKTGVDARAFADLANDLIDMCQYPNVLYYQADEVWHEDLVTLTRKEIRQGNYDLSFWRIQYCNNFQQVKWFPHLVHRVGQKNNFNFIDDGMNSDRVNDAQLVGDYDGGWFTKWGSLGQEGIKPYVNEMITDISNVGAFRDNIIEKRKLHAPFWHEAPDIDIYDPDGKVRRVSIAEWEQWAMSNPLWIKPKSPYNLPAILDYHIGKSRYEVRPELIEKLKVL